MDFREAPLQAVQPGSLAPLAEKAVEALKAAKQTVAVFEATTGGLVQAALLTHPGASAYAACGAVTYSPQKAEAVLGGVAPPHEMPHDAASYRESKKAWVRNLARRKREEVGAIWCIAESGCCGPTFKYPDLSKGFTCIYVSGPVEKGIMVESQHSFREQNMWSFTKVALDLLAECVEEASTKMSKEATSESVLASLEGSPNEWPQIARGPCFSAKEDRFGGVEVEALESVEGHSPLAFGEELRRGLSSWKTAGKQGIWLKIPVSLGGFVGPATDEGFVFHHAKPEYVLLTRWLPNSPSPLPKYGFTQIGVGGIVVNSKGEVLMVQERVSPLPMFQGSWKLPGGLADPGEDFAETVAREVQEETGVKTSLIGVVSLRHSHGVRFGQGDIYVLVKLRADSEEIHVDTHELLDAQWMSSQHIKSLVVASGQPLDGKVSENNWKMINNALTGSLIEGTQLPNSRGGKPTMLYTAPHPGSSSM
eukprot:TRINITY_DN13090_c1_g1_i1.p1 TRINITY_DN13090_c1_g1~~TRINITY_DN13090_c1_g1_i1.p1  ORF type:complete len:479 (+),score=102.63 TRINITY_DN13090_c1_g1_i1:107-1543(+)